MDQLCVRPHQPPTKLQIIVCLLTYHQVLTKCLTQWVSQVAVCSFLGTLRPFSCCRLTLWGRRLIIQHDSGYTVVNCGKNIFLKNCSKKNLTWGCLHNKTATATKILANFGMNCRWKFKEKFKTIGQSQRPGLVQNVDNKTRLIRKRKWDLIFTMTQTVNQTQLF